MYRLKFGNQVSTKTYTREEAQIMANHLVTGFPNIDIDIVDANDIVIEIKHNNKLVLETHYPPLAYIYAELLYSTDYDNKTILILSRKFADAYTDAKFEVNLNELVSLVHSINLSILLKADTKEIIKLYEENYYL